MFSAKSSGRRTLAARLTAAAVSVAALSLAVPAAAQAQPLSVWPNGPVIEVPVLPNTSQSQAPKPKPKPEPASQASPDGHVMPKVNTRTGWIALADDATHTIYWWKDGRFVKQMPISMGSDKHPTPNGTYWTSEQRRDMWMDSETYGVSNTSPEGYRTYVEYATRMSNSGIFIHAAPWSVAQQGNSNVSHGCINISTENGRWVYENIKPGTAIVVTGTSGGGVWNTSRAGM